MNSHQRRVASRVNATKTMEPAQEKSAAQPKQNDMKKLRHRRYMKTTESLGILASILGIVTGIFSFFPRLTVSEPIQMNATDLFSYKMTVTNDGVLPVFKADWALAPKIVKIQGSNKPVEPIHAAVVVYPNSALIGPEDYAFHLRLSDAYIGMLTPGDSYTFTTEGLMTAPTGAVADEVDFAIAVSYIPVFPPIPMQTCTRFHIYRDRQGTQHWFRAPNKCNRFPWLHHWFD
jgi:hypothetical protein